MLKLKVFCTLIAIAYAAPRSQEKSSLLEEAFDVYNSCSGEDLTVCLKLKALHFVDRVGRSTDFNLIDGLKIVKMDESKDSRDNVGRSLKEFEASLPNEIEAREAAVDDAILDRAAKFLSTHSVELSIPKELSRSIEEARAKKKKLIKSLLPILFLFKLKTAALIAVGVLALLAFKALVVGKIALIISLILGMQKLLAAKQQNFDIISHPAGGHEDHHDHHGWARSTGSDLAYSAYKPAN